MFIIAINAIGIIGDRANPKTLKRIFKVRDLIFSLMVSIVPASNKITIMVSMIPNKNGFLRLLFKILLLFNNPYKKIRARISIEYVAKLVFNI